MTIKTTTHSFNNLEKDHTLSLGGHVVVSSQGTDYSNSLKITELRERCKCIVMLLPVDTSTKWFAKLIEAKAHIFWHNGRLSFNGGKPPRFASMLVILNSCGMVTV